MPCTFARFVIHYKDGTTLIEDRNDSYCWDNASKENISALGIVYDPIPIGIKDPNTGKDIRITLDEHTLKGSSKYNYPFFMQKDAVLKLVPNAKPKTLGLMVGLVTNKAGHCVVMYGKPNGCVSTFYTTVHSLTLNLELFGIKLEECGKEIVQSKDSKNN